MNVKALVGIGVVIIIILIGVFMMRSKTAHAPADQTTMGEAGMVEGILPTEEKTEGTGAWMQALTSGEKLSCTYAMNQQGSQATTVTMQMEGQKYRSEIEASGMQYVTLFDGQTMYTWTPGQQQGTKMDMSCLDQFKSQTPPSGGTAAQYEKSPAEVLQNQPDIQCQPATSVDFSVPSDIKFTDQCAMMQQGAEMMKQYQNQIPSSSTPPVNY